MNEFEDFKKESELISEVLKNYRGRYSDYFISRFGMIPNIPQSYDNANDIYELLAWLQRAVKQLIDDMANLLLDWNDFQNALDDLLKELLPEILRKYFKSDEFKELFNNLINKWYNEFLKPILDDMRDDYNKKINDLRNDLTERINQLEEDLNNKINELREQLEREVERLEQKDRELEEEINQLKATLGRILKNLYDSGAWNSNSNALNDLLDGNFNANRNIATGNINLFGGDEDGDSFIRTNNRATENDLVGGI